jgi:hypothetical protein
MIDAPVRRACRVGARHTRWMRMARHVGVVVVLVGGSAVRPTGTFAWARSGGCELSTPDPGPDLVFPMLTPVEVSGLYKTLWAFRTRVLNGNGPIVDKLASNGHSVEVATSSPRCTNLGTSDPWNSAWSCALDISSRFALKKLTYQAFDGAVAGVSTVRTFNSGDVSYTDAVHLDQTATFDWDAGGKRLTVSFAYPGSSARNHQRTWGIYDVRSRSRVRVTVPAGFSGATAAQSSAAHPISASVSAVQSGSSAIVSAAVTGNPCWAERGLGSFGREPPNNSTESYFAFETAWETDAAMDLTASVIPNAQPCATQSRQSLGLHGRGFNGLATAPFFAQAFTDDSAVSTSCVPWTAPFISTLAFRAGDAFAPGCTETGCPGQTVGARILTKLHMLNQQNGSCKRWYDVGSTLLVNWDLSVQTPSLETGGGFDIGAGTAVRDWASAHHLSSTYACP